MLRFIPAGAGNTALRAGKSSTHSVYPRWRGEHKTVRRVAQQIIGLSPLARGTLHYTAIAKISRRFIPAGAGNTLPLKPKLTPGPVYPRWRGEHIKKRLILALVSGLSPLARGTRVQ